VKRDAGGAAAGERMRIFHRSLRNAASGMIANHSVKALI
jgi:hypothetical protein